MGTPRGAPELVLLENLTTKLQRTLTRIKRMHHTDDAFRPHIFRMLVSGAIDLAEEADLVAP